MSPMSSGHSLPMTWALARGLAFGDTEVVPDSAILLESGDVLLLETGDRLLLE